MYHCKIIIICIFNLYIINKLQYHYLLQEYTEFTAKTVNLTIIIVELFVYQFTIFTGFNVPGETLLQQQEQA